MKNVILTIIGCLLIMMTSPIMVRGQMNQDQLSDKIKVYGKVKTSTALFVHFDKTIYTNNETVWFTGYLLKAPMDEILKHGILSVALIRDIDSQVIKQEKYLLKDGISFGNMILPDSLISGNYHFQVTTNRVSKGKPDVSFVQSIIIKTNIDPSFNASIKLLEPGILGKKPNLVLITVTGRDARLLPKPAEVFYQYGKIHKKALTNALGELLVTLPEQTDLTDPNVYAKIKYGLDSAFVNLSLPVTVRKARVRFFPEGGNQVSGIPGKVALEVKDDQGKVVALKAALFMDNTPIDTIETNSYGIGQFVLKPIKDHLYTVKLIHSGFVDSTYQLPAAATTGVKLSVLNGVASDTLLFKLVSSQPQRIFYRIHDFRSTYLLKEYHLIPFENVLKIPLTGVKAGLNAITVTDSLNRPLAERIFFAHYNPAEKIKISSDSEIYGTRQRVTLRMKLSNMADSLALVSIACVQDNRISGALSNDIETYTYLKSELNALPMAVREPAFQNKDYIEDVLLTKGWRRYTWSDMLNVQSIDTLKTYEPVAVKIKVTRSNKPLISAIPVALFGESGTKILNSTPSGELILDNEYLLTEYNKKITVAAIGKGQQKLKVRSVDPFDALNKEYLKLIPLDRVSLPTSILNNNELVLKTNERAIRLKEVKITSGKDNSISYTSGKNKSGSTFGGCPYHPFGPGPGEICGFPCRGGMGLNVYDQSGRSVSPGGGAQLYQMMNGKPYQALINASDEKRDFIISVPGIYTKKEFYTSDYKDSLEPAFYSTLFWRHGELLNTEEKEIQFYTSDITGKFRVVVQGITNNNVIYGQYFFEVKNLKTK
jgi:hypothetical protein